MGKEEEEEKRNNTLQPRRKTTGLWLNCSLHLQAANVCIFHGQDRWGSVAHIFLFLMRCSAHAAPSLRLPAPSDYRVGKQRQHCCVLAERAPHEEAWWNSPATGRVWKFLFQGKLALARRSPSCCVSKLGVNQRGERILFLCRPVGELSLGDRWLVLTTHPWSTARNRLSQTIIGVPKLAVSNLIPLWITFASGELDGLQGAVRVTHHCCSRCPLHSHWARHSEGWRQISTAGVSFLPFATRMSSCLPMDHHGKHLPINEHMWTARPWNTAHWAMLQLKNK